MTSVATPPLGPVRAIIRALNRRDVHAVVGGSALLASLGLADEVRDWDVLTDATVDVVTAALDDAGVSFVDATTSDQTYASRCRLLVDAGNHSVDVIVGFALRTRDGAVIDLPASPGGRWRGLPMADPAVWELAYGLLGRQDRADLLTRWLNDHDPSDPPQ